MQIVHALISLLICKFCNFELLTVAKMFMSAFHCLHGHANARYRQHHACATRLKYNCKEVRTCPCAMKIIHSLNNYNNGLIRNYAIQPNNQKLQRPGSDRSTRAASSEYLEQVKYNKLNTRLDSMTQPLACFCIKHEQFAFSRNFFSRPGLWTQNFKDLWLSIKSSEKTFLLFHMIHN